MGLGRRSVEQLNFCQTARQDGRPWIMFIFGAIFALGACTIDPQKNCDVNSECVPWLVPIAVAVGTAFGLGGLRWLLANPNRGSCIDPDSGMLIWWQNRYGDKGGDEGFIDPMQISLIRIDRRRESADDIQLYDRALTRQLYFDEEVIGLGQGQRWADAMIARWPHIRVEVLD